MPSTRRQFLCRVCVGSSVAVVTLIRARPVDAQLPRLTVANVTAKVLAYVDDVAQVPAEEPLLKPGAHCGNCRHYQGRGRAEAPCALFPGYQVPAPGWCRAWAAPLS